MYRDYQPLFVFNQDGDAEAALLTNNNVHGADEMGIDRLHVLPSRV